MQHLSSPAAPQGFPASGGRTLPFPRGRSARLSAGSRAQPAARGERSLGARAGEADVRAGRRERLGCRRLCSSKSAPPLPPQPPPRSAPHPLPHSSRSPFKAAGAEKVAEVPKVGAGPEEPRRPLPPPSTARPGPARRGGGATPRRAAPSERPSPARYKSRLQKERKVGGRRASRRGAVALRYGHDIRPRRQQGVGRAERAAEMQVQEEEEEEIEEER